MPDFLYILRAFHVISYSWEDPSSAPHLSLFWHTDVATNFIKHLLVFLAYRRNDQYFTQGTSQLALRSARWPLFASLCLGALARCPSHWPAFLILPTCWRWWCTIPALDPHHVLCSHVALNPPRGTLLWLPGHLSLSYGVLPSFLWLLVGQRSKDAPTNLNKDYIRNDK